MPSPGNDALACGHVGETLMVDVVLLLLWLVSAGVETDPATETDVGPMIIHDG